MRLKKKETSQPNRSKPSRCVYFNNNVGKPIPHMNWIPSTLMIVSIRKTSTKTAKYFTSTNYKPFTKSKQDTLLSSTSNIAKQPPIIDQCLCHTNIMSTISILFILMKETDTYCIHKFHFNSTLVEIYSSNILYQYK